MIMLSFLKHAFLWLWLKYTRTLHRKALIEKITCQTKDRKRIDDIPDIRAVLDEVCVLPEAFEDHVSFMGFDKIGNTFGLNVHRVDNGTEVIHLDVALPGKGHFSHRELLGNRTVNYIENLTGSRRLIIYCHQPMKRWRVYFRGPMKHETDDGKTKQITISCYWTCLSDPYDHFVTPSCWTLAGNLSSLPWTDLVGLNQEEELRYEQLGEMRVRICADDEELFLRLKCVKERAFKNMAILKRKIVQTQYVSLERTGLFYSSQVVSFGNNEPVIFNYILFPIGDYSPALQECQSSIPGDSATLVKACGNNYRILEILKRFGFRNHGCNFYFARFSVSEKPAFGIKSECSHEDDIISDNEETHVEPENPVFARSSMSCERIVALSFDEPECKVRSLVGGKGSQLATLRSLAVCKVPDGICLTVNAYMQHLVDNPNVSIAIDQISVCIKNGQVANLKKTCETVKSAFQETSLSGTLKVSIKDALNKIFSDGEENLKRFAVRSSCVSEDGSQASSAGQLLTLLGINGFENIFDAVIECWASSFSYQAVEYRRQNGQPVTENMGVVIQEMVDSDVAGVMFAANPVDGDETKIVINASYGLGEAVVSGRVTPDTIIVKRCENDSLIIERIDVGTKEFQIKTDSAAGTIVSDIVDKDLEKACLNDTDIETLCKIGIDIERKLSSSQDIEWAMQAGRFYILQTRPITSVETETDDEIIQELDTPIVSDIELVTPCNVQEAMPGASSTLCTDVHVPAVDRSSKYNIFSRFGLKYPIFVNKVTLSFSGIALFGVTPIMPLLTHGLAGEKSKSNGEFNILGMAVEEQTVENINAFFGRSTSKTRKLINAAREMFILRKRDGLLYKQIKHKIETASIGEDAEAAEELYEAIEESLYLYYEMWRAMVFITASSSIKLAVMMNVLKGSTSEMTVENVSDIALLLSECKNVESAEVPNAINYLAKLIADSDIKETFLKLPLNECDQFLRGTDVDELSSKYTEFMEKHGHRCIKESDFFEKTWRQEPAKLIKMLKHIVLRGNFQTKEKERKTIEELVDSLQTPLTPFKKRLMKKMFVKNAMEGVAERERSKSFAMKACSIFKEAYWRLAEMLVREGRLPDEKLMFFLTQREIGILINERPVKLIRLAKRRMKLFPEMDKIKYEKINIGLPRPVKSLSDKGISAQFELKGMPVCRGKSTGRACVVQALDDADQILQGDILICRYTDVGWTPYFPLINGLVTELGGLISHGAVVARENGIPCVVNVANATEVFTTGDRVILDGTAGTISKILHCVGPLYLST